MPLPARTQRPRRRRGFRALAAVVLMGAGAAQAQLSLDPPNPTSIDTLRLRYAHVGCTNGQSVQVQQESTLITVQVERAALAPDCGTTAGFFEDFTLGRLPAGEYDVSLVVNPVPGSLAASQLLGPVHVSVARLAPAALLHPHDDYSDMWWNPREPGWALSVRQLSEKLFMVWATYDDAGKPAWLVVPGGSWGRDAGNILRFSGKVYRTRGSPWQLPFDASMSGVTPVGTAEFAPLDASHGIFSYSVDGIPGSKMVERFRF
ncbi:MAG TPA: hypothetical protein VHQ02_08160 [Usitatibacter sp.]|jgi:hypothetical protein|nr:hypothetical protein [Usitatibacter sp.]